MDENNPARLEAFVHVVDGQQRVAHVLGRVNELQFDRIASTNSRTRFCRSVKKSNSGPSGFEDFQCPNSFPKPDAFKIIQQGPLGRWAPLRFGDAPKRRT
jgi:hypothetical protein